MTPAANFIRSLGVPGLDSDAACGTHETSATRAVGEFLAHPDRRVLVLSGGCGAGKTLAAARWLASLPRYGKFDDTAEGWEWARPRIAFVRAHDLSRLNLKYRDEDRREFDRLRMARWLVLDDLFTESADAVSLVDDIVDFRCRRSWTVITTNLPCGPTFSESPFAKRYGERVASRIIGNGSVLGCGAIDLRRAP